MHIPDGFLSPDVAATAWGSRAASWDTRSPVSSPATSPDLPLAVARARGGAGTGAALPGGGAMVTAGIPVAEALSAVGLSGFPSRLPHHLSAGEKRRVCLAATQVIATHDLGFVARLCTRAVMLDRGAIVAGGATEDLLSDRALLRRHGLD